MLLEECVFLLHSVFYMFHQTCTSACSLSMVKLPVKVKNLIHYSLSIASFASTTQKEGYHSSVKNIIRSCIGMPHIGGQISYFKKKGGTVVKVYVHYNRKCHIFRDVSW